MTIAESSTAAASSAKTPEADKLEFVQLLGKLTPSPSEGATENEAELVAAAVAQHLEQVLNGPFLLWLETKIGLSETMGNQVCICLLYLKIIVIIFQYCVCNRALIHCEFVSREEHARLLCKVCCSFIALEGLCCASTEICSFTAALHRLYVARAQYTEHC
jgi:hypothetical protein